MQTPTATNPKKSPKPNPHNQAPDGEPIARKQ